MQWHYCTDFTNCVATLFICIKYTHTVYYTKNESVLKRFSKHVTAYHLLKIRALQKHKIEFIRFRHFTVYAFIAIRNLTNAAECNVFYRHRNRQD